MEMNITIDCSDWYPEDTNFSDYLKDEVVNNLTAELARKLYSLVNINDKGSLERQLKEAERSLTVLLHKKTKEIGKTLEEKMDSVLASFIKGEYVEVDSYGKITGTTTLEEIVKKKFKDYLNATVNNEGKASSYSGCLPRIEYLIGKMSDSILEKHTMELLKTKIIEEISDTNK